MLNKLEGFLVECIEYAALHESDPTLDLVGKTYYRGVVAGIERVQKFINEEKDRWFING